MDIDDTMINEIKKLSKKLVDDNITFPNEMDYFLIEQAMLVGASIAFQSMSKDENESIQITTKNGLLYRNNEEIPLPEADKVARDHGYVYAEQLIEALESNKDKPT